MNQQQNMCMKQILDLLLLVEFDRWDEFVGQEPKLAFLCLRPVTLVNPLLPLFPPLAPLLAISEIALEELLRLKLEVEVGAGEEEGEGEGEGE